MKIQLALDRMSIPEAVTMARLVHPYIDWIEIGTSLIKEYGMVSVETMKREFPEKVIVADMKTFDNAKYEFELCFKAGADVATVMGAASPVTIQLCMDTAERFGGQTMIDLLNTSPEQQYELAQYKSAIHCLHVSKDEQEHHGHKHSGGEQGHTIMNSGRLQLAIAGGITQETLPGLLQLKPSVIIVGSAITKDSDPALAAHNIKQWIEEQKERGNL